MKFVPWLLSALLAVALFINWQTSSNALAQKDAEIQDFKRLAVDANKKLESASQREVSVQVSFRKALMSSGQVARLTNQSDQTVAVSVVAERPSAGKTKHFELTIDPGLLHTKEIGELEGWAFVSGDTIKISQPGRRSLTFTTP